MHPTSNPCAAPMTATEEEPPMDSPLMSSLHRGLLVLTLNRPARNNALNAELAEALLQAFSEARRDDRVRAILIQAPVIISALAASSTPCRTKPGGPSTSPARRQTCAA